MKRELMKSIKKFYKKLFMVMCITILPILISATSKTSVINNKTFENDPRYIYFPLTKKAEIKGMPNVQMSTSGNPYARVFDVHGLITRKALAGLLDDSCINVVAIANRNQDHGIAEETPHFHFDDNMICESTKQIDQWFSDIKSLRSEKKTTDEATGKNTSCSTGLLFSFQLP